MQTTNAFFTHKSVWRDTLEREGGYFNKNKQQATTRAV
jgi:hypothetical protein